MNRDELDDKVDFGVQTIAENRPNVGLNGGDKSDDGSSWVVIYEHGYPGVFPKTVLGETVDCFSSGYPVGTVVKFHVPRCPHCWREAPSSIELKENPNCESCGKFNWVDWLNEWEEREYTDNDN